jgi:hypothetical protein
MTRRMIEIEMVMMNHLLLLLLRLIIRLRTSIV